MIIVTPLPAPPLPVPVPWLPPLLAAGPSAPPPSLSPPPSPRAPLLVTACGSFDADGAAVPACPCLRLGKHNCVGMLGQVVMAQVLRQVVMAQVLGQVVMAQECWPPTRWTLEQNQFYTQPAIPPSTLQPQS